MGSSVHIFVKSKEHWITALGIHMMNVCQNATRKFGSAHFGDKKLWYCYIKGIKCFHNMDMRKHYVLKMLLKSKSLVHFKIGLECKSRRL